MIQVYPIPAFQDNYLWLFQRKSAAQAYVVDPGDAQVILDALAKDRLTLAGILITHHHWDHTGGVRDLLEHHQVPVYGPYSPNIPHITHPLREGDFIELANDMRFRILEVPGHTLDHIAYVSENENPGLLFCGDTLFCGGCGRLFEGSAEQMYTSLSKLARLAENTLVYCAHEYTLSNLKFALAVEGGNLELQGRMDVESKKRLAGEPTVPSTIGIENATNPFMRSQQSSIKVAAEQHTKRQLDKPENVLGAIRTWKDNF